MKCGSRLKSNARMSPLFAVFPKCALGKKVEISVFSSRPTMHR
jgi:hypothetical protein